MVLKGRAASDDEKHEVRVAYTLKTLIISPDGPSRNRLKEALGATTLRNRVFQARNCSEGYQILAEEDYIGIIFFHSKIKEEPFLQLQKDTKGLKLKFQPIYIITLLTDHHLSDYISEQLVGGIEGFLREPFAANDVDDVIQLGLSNRQFQIDRDSVNLNTFQFMLRDALRLIDQAALERFKNGGRGGGRAISRLKRLKIRLRNHGKKLEPNLLLPLVEKEVALRAENLNLEQFARQSKKVKFAEHPGRILGRIIEERKLTTERLSCDRFVKYGSRYGNEGGASALPLR